MSQTGPRRWHALAAAEVMQAFEVDPALGLDNATASARSVEYGRNALPPPPRRGILLRFLAQWHNVLIYLLLAAAAVTFWLGEHVDAIVILAVVLINAVIGFVQEGKAERALEAVSSMLPLHATALRAGRRAVLDAAQLVPGDLVFLAAGDKVPADIRLIEAHSLSIDEAILTGESTAADKHTSPASAGQILAERGCMAYSGTLVRHGTGFGIVVATGSATEIGTISAMLGRIDPMTSPMLRKIAELGRWLTVTVLLVALAMFAFGTLVRGGSAMDMFSAAVALAIAVVPEGLPAVITITLAMGVQRMARRNAIIRRLPAVETLGAVTVICTDKTGTLTRNEMAVRQVIAREGVLEVSADGYRPSGTFTASGAEVDPLAAAWLQDIALACLLCNDAQLRQDGAHWRLSGDPTEGALLSLAMKAGAALQNVQALARIGVIPFESEHGFMATLHADQGGMRVVLKGAPEVVMPLCGAGGLAGASCCEAALRAAAAQGMRLIALATRTSGAPVAPFDLACVRSGGFTLLGIVAMQDPLREESVGAVAACLRAGIRIKMVTGDHAGTARAIGVQLGFPAPVTVITGAQLDSMADDQLAAALAEADVFARASPAHKLRLVQALQRNGEIVLMTGDGVNDAPALKCADVGVAMGHRGTDTAKEAAQMVLADDNFATLAEAVREGRVVYDNLRKTIVFTLPTNAGEAGMLMVAIAFGLTLPITPVQILWVNLVTEVTLSLALAFETAEDDVMQRPPRRRDAALVSGFLVWRIVFVSLLMVAGCTGLYLWELAQGGSLAQARTVVINGLVIGHIAYLFNSRRLSASALTREGWTGNRVALLASLAAILFQAMLTYWPALQRWFGTAGLGWDTWARIAGFGVLLLLAVEAEKALRRARSQRSHCG